MWDWQYCCLFSIIIAPFLDFCSLWLLVDSAIWFNHLLFTDVCTFNVNEKRLYQRSLVCGLCGSIDHSGFPFEKNWLERRSIDCLTLPNQTLSALCKHRFRLFHIYVLTNGITFSYWEKVLLLIFCPTFFYSKRWWTPLFGGF